MKLPPYLVYLKIKSEEGRGFGIWLPVFLLWPLVLILFVIALPFLLLADLITSLSQQPFHQFTRLIIAILMLLPEARDTAVDIHSGKSVVKFTVL
jgi:hypothetical protein